MTTADAQPPESPHPPNPTDGLPSDLSDSPPPASALDAEPSSIVASEASDQVNLQVAPASKGSFWGVMTGTITQAVGTVGHATAQAGGAIAGSVSGAAGVVGNAASQAGGAIAGTVAGAVTAVGSVTSYATNGVGSALEQVTNNTSLRELTKSLQLGRFIDLIDRVDVTQASMQVKKLQQKYPNDPPAAIAHRIMVEKALYVGGTGFASSLMPGFAAAMFAVDLMATLALQAEMVYQIAAAYGLDLQDPARKGEVAAIFGMTLGGNAAVRAGLGLVRNLPAAGAVIGASSNAAMLYTLGHAACRFYEAKQQASISPLALKASQSESDDYLHGLLRHQVVMDQILVHVWLAGHPDRTLSQLLPELETLPLSPASAEAIAAQPNALPPLDQLLEQLDRDFAVVLVSQCYKIAHADGVITPEENRLLDTITQQLSSHPAS